MQFFGFKVLGSNANQNILIKKNPLKKIHIAMVPKLCLQTICLKNCMDLTENLVGRLGKKKSLKVKIK